MFRTRTGRTGAGKRVDWRQNTVSLPVSGLIPSKGQIANQSVLRGVMLGMGPNAITHKWDVRTSFVVIDCAWVGHTELSVL